MEKSEQTQSIKTTLKTKEVKKEEVKKVFVKKEEFVDFIKAIAEENKYFTNQPLSKDLDFCFIFSSLYLGDGKIEKATSPSKTTYTLISFDKKKLFSVSKTSETLSFNLKSIGFGATYNSEYRFKHPFCRRDADIKYFPIYQEMRYKELSRLNAADGVYFSEITDTISRATTTSFLSKKFNVQDIFYSYASRNSIKQFRKASSEFKEVPFIEPYGATKLLEMVSEHFNEASDMLMFDDEGYFDYCLEDNMRKFENSQVVKSEIEKKKKEERKKIYQEKLLAKKLKEKQRVEQEILNEKIRKEQLYVVDKKYISKKKITK